MIGAMSYVLTEGQLDPPARPSAVENMSSELGVPLPGEYLDFLRQHNGGEGFVGENYVVFWKAEELAQFNREYEVKQYAPGIILFGSDGGGEGYGFDTQVVGMPIVRIPFIGMDRRYATLITENFSDLFAKLAGSL